MNGPKPRLLLWTGPKHSGKSSAARRLVDAAAADGIAVAGILAPALYRNELLVGFDLVDIVTNSRQSLARRTGQPAADVGPFAFRPEAIRDGHLALHPDVANAADLVVVDEYGPFELRCGGWRRSVDQLLRVLRGTLLLVVRNELAGQVAQLYAPWHPQRISATSSDAIDRALRVIRQTIPQNSEATKPGS